METALEARNVTASQVVNQSWLKAIDDLEAWMLEQPDAIWEPEVLVHHFSPGIYIREIHMRAGEVVIGMRHRTEHFNVVLQGKARVFMEGHTYDVHAPFTMKSGVDVRKVLWIQEPMIWQTIHANPDNETDISVLEERLFWPTELLKSKRMERMNLITTQQRRNLP